MKPAHLRKLISRLNVPLREERILQALVGVAHMGHLVVASRPEDSVPLEARIRGLAHALAELQEEAG